MSLSCDSKMEWACFIAVQIIALFVAVPTVSAQSVQGNGSDRPFIDTSEWVQSSSPISDGYVTQGYITETIVRGYRGPGSTGQPPTLPRTQNAIEFSEQEKIQPIIYTTDRGLVGSASGQRPVTQASYGAPDGTSTGLQQVQNPPNFRPVPTSSMNSMRGYQNVPYVQPGPNPIRTAVYTSVAGQQIYRTAATGSQWPATPVIPTSYQAAGGSVAGAPSIQNQPVYQAPVAQPYQPMPTYNGALQNCYTPAFQPTQFVTPSMGGNPAALTTYPQYRYPGAAAGYGQNVRDTWVPMIPLRAMPYGVYLGQGIVGQPVAYVDGEPVRNFLRYVFP